MHLVLEIASGPGQGKAWEVHPGQTVRVGRHAPATAVCGEDARMSNLHFALAWDGPTCLLRDLQSRFGTHVNQARVTEAALKDGDLILAGTTAFRVRLVGAPAPTQAPRPAATPEPPKVSAEPAVAQGDDAGARAGSIPDQVLRLFRTQPEPLYALLDAARDPLVLARLHTSEVQFQSLYEGEKGAAMAAFGPFLVRLPAGDRFLNTLLAEGWGKSWGVFLTGGASFEALRDHFRGFLTIELPGRKKAYFRFYDPRVLRAFLPTCTPPEARAFFGPVVAYWMEAASPEALLRFTLTGDRLVQHRHRLATAAV
jgi:hypothetical protein